MANVASGNLAAKYPAGRGNQNALCNCPQDDAIAMPSEQQISIFLEVPIGKGFMKESVFLDRSKRKKKTRISARVTEIREYQQLAILPICT
jgi:hypothetical protein